jgi:hypothetical protein
MTETLVLLALLAQQPAPPAGTPPPPPTTRTPAAPEPPAAPERPAASEADFAAALAADQAAQQAAQPAPTTAPTATPTSAALMNPETSVILTGAAGVGRRPVAPVVTSAEDAAADSTSLQEVEVTFAADVDPYFKARLFLAIPHLEAVEVEEGYLITTSLPLNLQLKGGIFRSAFGRNNEQHLHVQDFARRPLTTAVLGFHGLKPAGAQLSVLLPLPWYVVLWAEGFTLTPRKASLAFGLEQFFELGRQWSLLFGLSGANLAEGAPGDDGHLHDLAARDVAEPVAPPRQSLAGADLYLKWLPVSETPTYFWLAFTAEYIATRNHGDQVLAGQNDWRGAGYAQLVAQVARRWRVGIRGDADGYPRTPFDLRAIVASASLTFLPTEFSRVRFTYQHQQVSNAPGLRNDYFFLQLEGTIGAHGAHPF